MAQQLMSERETSSEYGVPLKTLQYWRHAGHPDVPFTGDVKERLLRGSFRNGKKHGPWVGYHDNGRLEGKGTYKDGVKISD